MKKTIKATESTAMSKTITKLEKLFDKLNENYFEGKLPRPIITVQSTPKAYGHCTTKEIWRAAAPADSETEKPVDGKYEINLGAEYINRPIANTAATLVHEMVHLYCLINEIADTCQRGRYHNKTFKEEAEKRDLHIEYDRTIGYSVTSPTEGLEFNLKSWGFIEGFKLARLNPMSLISIGKATGTGAAAPRNKSHKYVCPCCGQTVRSTSDLNIICGICEEPFAKVS